MPYKWSVLLCLMPGIMVFLIDVTVVNVALATLGAAFSVQVDTVQWVITAFSLASGIATPMASYIEGRFTMRRVWIAGLVTFTSASVLCGLAPAFSVLVLGRILQGMSGGLMLPLAISTLFRAFPPGERGMALGFFAIPLVAGPALGPTIGGYIVTNLDWRYVFFVNVPIGIAAIVLALLFLHRDTPRHGERFDLTGAIFSTLGFGCSLYGLSRVDHDGWGSISVLGFVGFGLLNLLAFFIYEAEHEKPLLEVRLFLLPRFFFANLVGWVSTIALFGAEFMLPLYLQQVRGLTAFDTGLLLLPQGLSIAVAGPLAGRLVDRFGARIVVMGGFVLLAYNTWEMSHITLDTTYDTLRELVAVRGLALGAALQPTQLVALGVVPESLRTAASSMNNAMRSIFQSFGIAMLSTVVQTQTQVHSAVLAWQVGPETLSRVAADLQAHGIAPTLGPAEILAALLKQSAVLAFADAYRITFFAALAAIAVASLLPGKGEIKVDPMAALSE
ncbi:MAG: DHA2 family efflux MFS transporter permease subunit [Chloroflexota bacterium]|nr:DHA2 family efflux MFS transporter permease subunit [Chloroflexota bacterium]MDE3192545.1 DHA2 family efflux MFS transporter permease subunit [Chloroflexota bacterium]